MKFLKKFNESNNNLEITFDYVKDILIDLNTDPDFNVSIRDIKDISNLYFEVIKEYIIKNFNIKNIEDIVEITIEKYDKKEFKLVEIETPLLTLLNYMKYEEWFYILTPAWERSAGLHYEINKLPEIKDKLLTGVYLRFYK
jgi:hypothetical protein